MKRQEKPIRIGRINFTNVWPIFYYFPVDELGDKVQLISQVPTGLNEAMSSGRIHMGPISSFAYGESFDQYSLFPDLSVSCYGRVNSILLFYKKPFKEIIHGKIALPTTSATSVNLLKIIIEKFYDGRPVYSYASPSLDDMMKDTDAALLIGDDAIRAKMNRHDYEMMDLGELWTKLTGHWMSFAVWAVRKEVADSSPELVTEIFQAFQKSKRLGIQQPEPMIAQAQATVGGTYDFWKHYFSQLRYDFGSAQMAGLQLYFQYALELGLIDKEVPLQIWNNKRVVQVKE